MGILKVSATIGLGGGPRLRIRKVKKTFRLPLVSPVSVPILKNDNLFLRGEFEGGERFGVRGKLWANYPHGFRAYVAIRFRAGSGCFTTIDSAEGAVYVLT
jgi:hypothetical protein